VYNGELYVGGSMNTAGGSPVNNIAKWNGTTWSNVGTGLTGGSFGTWALCMAVYNGDLVVGGMFAQAGSATVSHIAKWNGTAWSAFGGTGFTSSHPFGGVYSLRAYNSDLVACGRFVTAGGVSANNIARWNGSAWSALG